MKKEFDAVQLQREIRDQLSKEIMNMTFEEEKAYLKKLLEEKEPMRLQDSQQKV